MKLELRNILFECHYWHIGVTNGHTAGPAIGGKINQHVIEGLNYQTISLCSKQSHDLAFI